MGNGIGWMSAVWLVAGFLEILWGFLYTNFLSLSVASAMQETTLEVRAVKYVVIGIFCILVAIMCKRD